MDLANHFPKTRDQAQSWKPIVRWRALSHNVLVVANTREEGAWKAYIAAVPGQNHDNEIDEVLSRGTAVSEDLARLLFPCFDEVGYSR